MNSSNSQILEPADRSLTSTTRNVGKAVRRMEDLRIIRGKGGYTDDIELANQHYAAILSSPYAHARIKRIDTSKAISLPGVVLVLTGQEAAKVTKPMTSRAATVSPKSHYIMANDKVRYMGEPVAAVVATTKYIAQDAVDLIEVEYEPLPVIASIDDAMKKDAPRIYEELDSNEIVTDHFEFGDLKKAFRDADRIVKDRIRIHRYASTPLETFVVNSFYDQTRDELLVYATDQQPGRTVGSVSACLGIPSSNIRLIVPPVGGGFGYKLAVWQYVAIMSLLSMKCGKPVKWVQTRMESLYAFHRPRGCMDAEFALRSDGKILGVKLTDWQSDGNWPYVSALYSLIKFANMSGVYEVPNLQFEYHCVATNDPPVVQDRGVGKPFMAFVFERMMDLSAKELGIDRARIREINFVAPEKMPYTTASGEVYESGNYPLVFQKALEMSRYQYWMKEIPKMRREGRYVGIGIGCAIEPGTSNLGYYFLSKASEPDYNGAGQMSTVEIGQDGLIKVNMNGPEIGTGHVTTITQVVGDIFDIEAENVLVDSWFDSAHGHLTYAGTYSNAFNDVYLGAVMTAAKRLRDKALRISASYLHVPVESLSFRNGTIFSEESEKELLSLKHLAKISYGQLLSFPKGEEPGLKVVAGYVNPTAKPFVRSDFNVQLTHANSTHVVVVEISKDTWAPKILDYVIVHDAGRVLNPGIVEGLAIGSTASGIGGALYEEFLFDQDENNLTLTFGDYMKPTAMEIPEIRLEMHESPAPNTVLGTKAVGEGGAITSLGAVASAVENALEPFNVRISSLPITPENIWKMIRDTDEYRKLKGVK